MVRTSPPHCLDEGARRLGIHLVQRLVGSTIAAADGSGPNISASTRTNGAADGVVR